MEAEETAIDAQAITPETVKSALVPPKEAGAGALVKIGGRGVELNSLEDLLRFARMATESGLAPKGMTTQGAALAIQAGLERGLGPLGGLQNLVVVNGNLSWKGQAGFALVVNSPVCKPGSLKFWTEGEGKDMVGVAVGWRVGYPEPWRRTFSVADAGVAGLWDKVGPWKQHPAVMLAWRALGMLLRALFPDVLGGFPLAEEAQDFDLKETTRGDTPAKRVAAGLVPPPATDPLAGIIDVEAEVEA